LKNAHSLLSFSGLMSPTSPYIAIDFASHRHEMPLGVSQFRPSFFTYAGHFRAQMEAMLGTFASDEPTDAVVCSCDWDCFCDLPELVPE
jgi:hypothetical protein